MNKIHLFLFLIMLGVIQPAIAGDYEIVEGKGVDVCEAYKKNLESFDNGGEPMACNRKINSKFKDFERPKRTKLDVWKYKKLLRKIEVYLGRKNSYGNPEKDSTSWESLLKSRIKFGHVRMELARIDINNNGKINNVIYYYNGRCQTTSSYGTPIVILNNELTDIDKSKTLYVMQNLETIDNLDAGDWAYAMYSIFKYKNMAYFDRWSDGYDQKGFLRVFKLKNERDTKICTYEYMDDK